MKIENFSVEVTELIGKELITETAGTTMGKELKNELNLEKSFTSKHSIIRSNVYKVVMKNIPTFASVHLVRHNVGVQHWVKSNRPDRGGTGEENRMTPVNHTFIANAEALMNISYKRLCSQASPEVRVIMQEIKDKVTEITPELKTQLNPTCIEKGFCPEFKPCNYVNTEKASEERKTYLNGRKQIEIAKFSHKETWE